MAGYKNYGYGDIESAVGQPAALYPGIPGDENVLRWAFIRKVYGILSVQLVLTTLVSGIVVFTPAVLLFLQSNGWSLIFISILPLICECWFLNLAHLPAYFVRNGVQELCSIVGWELSHHG
jgi:hypothetical protein